MRNGTCTCVTCRDTRAGRGTAFRTGLLLLLCGILILLAVDSTAGEYRLLSYGERAALEPRFRTMGDGLGWSSESWALPACADARWVVLRPCPRREEAILAVLDTGYNLTVQVWNGIGWCGFLRIVNNPASGNCRFFDVAYESVSGDAVIVYGTSDGRSPRYRTWNGTSWSEEGFVDLPGDRTRPQYWVVLEQGLRSDEIVLVCQDDYRRLYASVWNGNAWHASIGEFDKSRTDNYLGFSICREGLSGEALVAWRPEEQPYLQYMTWDGIGWGPIMRTQDLPLGFDAGIVKLAGDPESDRAILGVGDIHGDLALSTWSGSDWGSFNKLADNFRVTGNNRSWDFTFEKTGGRALLVYSEGDSPELRYRCMDGLWGLEELGPRLRGPLNILKLDPDRSGIMLFSTGEASNIECMRWNGSGFSAPDQLETRASANEYEPLWSICLADRGPGIAVTSPNGGERLSVGQIHLITWNARQDIAGGHVDIHYTTAGAAGGIAWKPIVLGAPNTFQYQWHVPNEPSEQCLVKVRLFSESMSSSWDASDSVFAIYGTTGAYETVHRDPAPCFELLQNEPNPFLEGTDLRVLAAGEGEADLIVRDPAGRRVRGFFFRTREGENRLAWDGRDEQGIRVPPGVYFCCLKVKHPQGNFGATRKMTFLR